MGIVDNGQDEKGKMSIIMLGAFEMFSKNERKFMEIMVIISYILH